MTQFRILPIRRGDAYLLQSPRGSYLMDGGGHGYDLPELLEERHAKKLRAAICSSACPERLGGILELMESEHAISEYWLPEGMERLIESARRFNGDWHQWVGLISDDATQAPPTEPPHNDATPSRYLASAVSLAQLAMTACLIPVPASGQPDYHFRAEIDLLSARIATRHKHGSGSMRRSLQGVEWYRFLDDSPENRAFLCGRLLFAEAALLPGGTERGTRAVAQGLPLPS